MSADCSVNVGVGLHRGRRAGGVMASSRIPASYVAASWRGTLPADPITGEQALSFDLADGSTVRLRLDVQGVQQLRDSLAPGYVGRLPMGDQSAMSSLIPSAPKSAPSDGVQV